MDIWDKVQQNWLLHFNNFEVIIEKFAWKAEKDHT